MVRDRAPKVAEGLTATTKMLLRPYDLRGTARETGEEHVRAVVPGGLDAPPGPFDRAETADDLRGATDAGRPKLGVTGDRLGQRPRGDDVGQGHAPGRGEHPDDPKEHHCLVRTQVNHTV